MRENFPIKYEFFREKLIEKEFASDCEITNDASIKLHRKLGFGEASKLVHFAKKL